MSLFYSKFLLSISTFALVFLSIVRITHNGRLGLAPNRMFFNSFKLLFHRPPYLAIATLFFVCVVSGVNSSNIAMWFQQCIYKIPFLAFPIIFLNRPAVSSNEYRNLYLCLIIVSFLSAIQVTFNYTTNYDVINKAIGSGHSIPTPYNHTRYSIMIAVATLATFVLNISNFSLNSVHRRLIGLAGFMLFIFLHVLSIRSGLVALYAGTFLLGVYYLVRERKILLLILFVLGLVTTPFVAYNTFTSFKKKVHYTIYDFKMNKEGKGDNYSDSERLLSIKTGIDLIKRNPLLGTGIGDLEDTVMAFYQQEYNKSLFKLPHNQFVHSATGMGLILGLIYTICFIIPLLYQRNYRDLFLLSFFLALTLFCMVEKPLERSSFIAFYISFVCAGISYLDGYKHNLKITA